MTKTKYLNQLIYTQVLKIFQNLLITSNQLAVKLYRLQAEDKMALKLSGVLGM